MKNKRLKLTGILIVLGGLLVLCGAATLPKPVESSINLIANLFGKNVVLATGINFLTGKSIVLNPITGEEVTSCNSKSVTPSVNGGCTTQINVDTSLDPELATVISSSEKIINGVIRKNGKDIPARFITTVTAVYEGSECTTLIVGGNQYEHCITDEGGCAFVAPLSRYGNKSESVRKTVRKACGAIPPTGVVPTKILPAWKKTWRINDCNRLRLVYRTAKPTIPATSADGAVTYTLAYKQYIWDSCKSVPPLTWGNRPTVAAP
jgi:hypothetical protein